MKEHLWDGNIDCGWEELQHRVVDISNKFASDMLEIVSYSPYDITKELINQETMERFGSLSENLSEHISKGEYCEYEDIENKNNNAYRLTGWILLGSLTETALQMFLAFYIDDYQRSKWQQWEDVDIAEVKNPIIDSINNLVANKTITAAQGKSLKKAIKDKIKVSDDKRTAFRKEYKEFINSEKIQKIKQRIEAGFQGFYQRRSAGTYS